MTRGRTWFVLLAVFTVSVALNDIESELEHWKTEASNLKAKLRKSESINETQAAKLNAQAAELKVKDSTISEQAAKLKAHAMELKLLRGRALVGESTSQKTKPKIDDHVDSIMAQSAKAASDNAKGGSWKGYHIASDLNNGAPSLFTVRRVAQWKSANGLAFGWDTQLHFREYKGFDFIRHRSGRPPSKKKFESQSKCKEFYEEKVKKFSVCGEMGGSPLQWRLAGCPSLRGKPAPCTGTFGGASLHLSQQNPAYNNSVTARYEERTSNLDNKTHRFYAITNTGKAADGTSECKADSFVRIGMCKSCCCTEGLIQYEIQNTEDRSNTKVCRDWFMSAVAAASSFFGMWRLHLSIKKLNACSTGGLSQCPSMKKKLLGEPHLMSKQPRVWSKGNAWQCISSLSSRSGNCY